MFEACPNCGNCQLNEPLAFRLIECAVCDFTWSADTGYPWPHVRIEPVEVALMNRHLFRGGTDGN